MYLTWFDSNSWLIELADQRILLDPWLVDDLAFGNAKWFFRGYRQQDRAIPENIDLILLSQGLEDHAHPPTLKALDKSIPVVGSPAAAKVVRALGFQNVTALDHGETNLFGERLEIQATVGSPVGPTAKENGYVLKDVRQGTSLYYEPHGYHPTDLSPGTIDVVLTPMMDLSIPPGLPVIKGMQSAADLAEAVQPQVMVPTSAGGDIEFSGLLAKVLRATGSPVELQAKLVAAGLATQIIEPKPGDRCNVPLKLPVR
ncbi:MBL fold metallo-hydrolase [filamentous cyanobacterium LEGE 11480]|uniref:MBL fold metallo-hydrolase n=1 Tax=Romeriopsis navalis LEGE 11480 TaxID=2777977 RepID=A0A928VH21_9CYAN|nr:MBL fold metallo-hydrolase [Romeriopsis navalis]MBE9028468.1 MBL fold metallo-hydrolase [Romeriopsis navalis LEGE 11480]